MSAAVAIVDHRFDGLDIERQVLAEVNATVVDGAGMTAGEALSACAAADAVIVGARLALDAPAIGSLKQCLAIVRYGVGVDNVDVDAATAAGIWVACVPDYCIDEVAEHTIALVLALSRRLFLFDALVRDGAWGIPAGLPIHRLRGLVLGVFGFGRIGAAVGRRASALGMRVLAHDPAVPDDAMRAAGAEPAEEEVLLRTSDIVTLHAPRLGARPILDATAIDALKPGCAVINVARGGLLDEEALIRGLQEGRLSGGALDVADAEPLQPPHPLLEAPNLIITPHAAWYSLEATRDLRVTAAQEVARVLAGHAPRNPVNAVET
jgi:D-3-phosphoglycerate dehydrogenase